MGLWGSLRFQQRDSENWLLTLLTFSKSSCKSKLRLPGTLITLGGPLAEFDMWILNGAYIFFYCISDQNEKRKESWSYFKGFLLTLRCTLLHQWSSARTQQACHSHIGSLYMIRLNDKILQLYSAAWTMLTCWQQGVLVYTRIHDKISRNGDGLWYDGFVTLYLPVAACFPSQLATGARKQWRQQNKQKLKLAKKHPWKWTVRRNII